MKLTQIDLYSDELEIASFGLRDTSSQQRYIAQNIAGLDADDIVSKYYGSGAVSKLKFFNSTLRPRDIVIRVVLNPQYSINESFSDLRDGLYRAIASSRSGLVTLYFKDAGTTVAFVQGHVTKFESTYFTGNPEVTLTIHCDEPQFKAINPVVYSAAKLGYTNPIRVGDSISTAPHGFTARLNFTTAVPYLTISNALTNADWSFTISPSNGFLNGDILTMSNEGKKQLFITRGASTIHLMDRISVGSVWPVVFPGSNPWYFTGLGNFTWTSLVFTPVHWGV